MPAAGELRTPRRLQGVADLPRARRRRRTALPVQRKARELLPQEGRRPRRRRRRVAVHRGRDGKTPPRTAPRPVLRLLPGGEERPLLRLRRDRDLNAAPRRPDAAQAERAAAVAVVPVERAVRVLGVSQAVRGDAGTGRARLAGLAVLRARVARPLLPGHAA